MSSNPGRGSRVRALLLLLLTLITGVIIGIAADRFLLMRRGQMYPRRSVHFISDRVVDKLDRELELSTDQRAKISAIVKRRSAVVDAAWKNVKPMIRSEIEKTDREIEQVLNPDQKKKFVQLRSKWNRRARHFTGPR